MWAKATGTQKKRGLAYVNWPFPKQFPELMLNTSEGHSNIVLAGNSGTKESITASLHQKQTSINSMRVGSRGTTTNIKHQDYYILEVCLFRTVSESLCPSSPSPYVDPRPSAEPKDTGVICFRKKKKRKEIHRPLWENNLKVDSYRAGTFVSKKLNTTCIHAFIHTSKYTHMHAWI